MAKLRSTEHRRPAQRFRALATVHGRALYVVAERWTDGVRRHSDRPIRCCRDCGAIDLGKGYGPPLAAQMASVDPFQHLPAGVALAFLRSPAEVVAYFGAAGKAWETARHLEARIEGFTTRGPRTAVIGLPELPEVFVQRISPSRWGRFRRAVDGAGWSLTAYKSKGDAVKGRCKVEEKVKRATFDIAVLGGGRSPRTGYVLGQWATHKEPGRGVYFWSFTHLPSGTQINVYPVHEKKDDALAHLGKLHRDGPSEFVRETLEKYGHLGWGLGQ